MQGKPKYTLYSTIGASLVHWLLCYLFCFVLDWKMFGVALASSIHFCFRAVILIGTCLLDKDLAKCEISLFHEDSKQGLREMATVGWNTMLIKVMGWWAFDVFT
jgi:Na+-driven multidrug efflux pump